MIEIRLLEQLAAFAEFRTLSLAAEKLHTSQPALTRSMKKLEEDLGVSLFIRSRNHLELNETGLYAAEYARRVLESSRDFEESVRKYDRSLHTISVGYCAPVPQAVLTPMMNDLFAGMTISSDMMDDSSFEGKLLDGTYQLAVMHHKPHDTSLFCKKCGHEDLFISLKPSHPLASRSELSVSELDGAAILLLSRIGFWENMHREKTPNARYLLQSELDSLNELADNSDFPIFASSYFLRRGESLPDRINIPLSDPECHTDFYLVCRGSERGNYRKLFDIVQDNTIW